MKKGSLPSETIAKLKEHETLQKPYFSLQFVDTIKKYFGTYFESSVTVTSNVTSPSNIVTNGYNIATFFKEALRLDRGNHLLHINIEEIVGFKLKITVSAEGGLALTSEAEERLRVIAKESNFDFDIVDGSLIMIQKMEILTTITLNATYVGSSLMDEFKRAFRDF